MSWGTDDLEPETLEQAEMGRAVPGTAYVALVEEMHAYGRELASWWTDFDLLVTPTIPELPAERSEDGHVPADLRPTMEFTAPFNISGQPAISLPLHRTPDGIPVGVQLVAGADREDVLLAVSAQLEESIPWHHHYPARGAGSAGPRT